MILLLINMNNKVHKIKWGVIPDKIADRTIKEISQDQIESSKKWQSLIKRIITDFSEKKVNKILTSLDNKVNNKRTFLYHHNMSNCIENTMEIEMYRENNKN